MAVPVSSDPVTQHTGHWSQLVAENVAQREVGISEAIIKQRRRVLKKGRLCEALLSGLLSGFIFAVRFAEIISFFQ